MILERAIHKVKPGKWDDLMALETQLDALQARVGMPPRKRYRLMFGGGSEYTEVIEREWESLAAREAFWAKLPTDATAVAEGSALMAQVWPLIESTQREVYEVL